MTQIVDINTIDLDSSPATAKTNWLFGLAFLGVLLIGGILRLAGLGGTPLSPAEAANALSVWQFLQAGGGPPAVSSPAYFSLTSLVMTFLGDSDATARLVPALFGMGLLLLPLLLRARFGRWGTLTAALLLAISPLFTAVSRSADGNSIALFAVALTAVAAIRFGDEGAPRWLYILGAALGLGAASAPLFYTGLVTLAAAWLLQQTVGPALSDEKQTVSRELWLKTAVFGLVAVLALSTRLLTFPSGLGASAGILGAWITWFSLGGDLQQLLEPFLLLARYETALLSLGIAAIIWAVWKNNALGTMLVYWLTGGLVMLLVQRSTLENGLIVALAGVWLLALFTQSLLNKEVTWRSWLLAAALAALGGVLFVNSARFLRVSIYEPNFSNVWMGLIAFSVAALLIYFVWMWSETAVFQGVWLALLMLVVFYQWGTARYLNHAAANDPRERWVTEASDDGAPLLANMLRDISRQVANSDNGLQIHSAVDTPVLAWYLRDFTNLQLGETLPPAAQSQALITPASMSEPGLGSDYIGMDFGLTRSSSSELILSEKPVQDALRWWLFHETNMPITRENVILWVRADLVQAP